MQAAAVKSLWGLYKPRRCILDSTSGNVVLACRAVLIPAFPERLDSAAAMIDGAILTTVTCYVKTKTQSDPKNKSKLFRTITVCFSAGIQIHQSPSPYNPPTVTSVCAAVDTSYGCTSPL